MSTANLNKQPLVQGVKGIFAAFHGVLENINVFYNDEGALNGIRGYSCNNDSELFMTDDLIKWVKRQMQNVNTASLWLDPDVIGTNNDAISLFNEKAKTLIIYYPNYYRTDKNDLIILYPKFTNSTLSFSKNTPPIQEKKDIIFGLMNHAVKERLSSEYETQRKFQNTFKDLENYTQDIKRRQFDFVKYILTECHNMDVPLEKAEQFIINFKESPEYLIEIVKKAIEIAHETQGDGTMVNDIHIDLARKKLESSKIALPDISSVSSVSKTYNSGHISLAEGYLDDLEKAISTTYSYKNKNNIRLKDIALNMRRPCTPSAIIDRIKKYKRTETHCFEMLINKDKSRWALVEECRPIQKLLDK